MSWQTRMTLYATRADRGETVPALLRSAAFWGEGARRAIADGRAEDAGRRATYAATCARLAFAQLRKEGTI